MNSLRKASVHSIVCGILQGFEHIPFSLTYSRFPPIQVSAGKVNFQNILIRKKIWPCRNLSTKLAKWQQIILQKLISIVLLYNFCEPSIWALTWKRIRRYHLTCSSLEANIYNRCLNTLRDRCFVSACPTKCCLNLTMELTCMSQRTWRNCIIHSTSIDYTHMDMPCSVHTQLYMLCVSCGAVQEYMHINLPVKQQFWALQGCKFESCPMPATVQIINVSLLS